MDHESRVSRLRAGIERRSSALGKIAGIKNARTRCGESQMGQGTRLRRDRRAHAACSWAVRIVQQNVSRQRMAEKLRAEIRGRAERTIVHARRTFETQS